MVRPRTIPSTERGNGVRRVVDLLRETAPIEREVEGLPQVEHGVRVAGAEETRWAMTMGILPEEAHRASDGWAMHQGEAGSLLPELGTEGAA